MKKIDRIAREQQLMEGLATHIGKIGVIVIKGKKHKVSDVLTMLQARVDASKPVTPAKMAWLQLVENERRVLAETSQLVADVREYVALVHGSSREVLAAFGIVPKTRPLTVDEKTERVAKAQATRKARGTRGHRQKEKVKGIVEDPPAPTPERNGDGVHLNGA
jgi:hypothetical protein